MDLIFYPLAALLIVTAIGVIASSNPIHSALFLVLNLLSVAVLFATLDAHFLAAVQVVVYAGAIMVLVVFVLMLLNLKVEAPKRPGLPTLIGGGITAIVFFVITVPLIEESFRAFREPVQCVVGSVSNIGKVLYTAYIFPFEIASILIMAAIVGAVMLSRRRVASSRGASDGRAK